MRSMTEERVEDSVVLPKTVTVAPIKNGPTSCGGKTDSEGTLAPVTSNSNSNKPPTPIPVLTTTPMPIPTPVLPPTTTTTVPLSGVTIAGTGAAAQPTFMNSGGGFQILNMNAIRASIQGGTGGSPAIVQTTQGGPKTLASRMILSPQVIGARPGQTGVSNSPEFISNSDNPMESSVDSQSSSIHDDVFDTKKCDDDDVQVPPPDKEETVLSPPLPSAACPPDPTTLITSALGEDPSEVLCLGEVNHHHRPHSHHPLVHPFPKDNNGQLVDSVFPLEPQACQNRFSPENNKGQTSPILNLDEDSHSDIILFNPVVQSQEVLYNSKDSQAQVEFSFEIGINQDSFSPKGKLSSEVTPEPEAKLLSPSPITKDVQEEFGQTRQSILVPNTNNNNIVMESDSESVNALLVQHRSHDQPPPAQSTHQWTSRLSVGNAAHLISPSLGQPNQSRQNFDGSSGQAHTVQPHHPQVSPSSSYQQFFPSPKTQGGQIRQFSPTYRGVVPHISPTHQGHFPHGQFSPESHGIPTQFSPGSHPKSFPGQYPLPQQLSPNTQPHHSQFSPTFQKVSPTGPNRRLVFNPSQPLSNQGSSDSQTTHHYSGSHLAGTAQVQYGPVFRPPPPHRSPSFPPSCQMEQYAQNQKQHSPNLISPTQSYPPRHIPRSFSYSGDSGGAQGQIPHSIQYKGQGGDELQKCFTTDAQLQSQYLQYTQSHPISVQVKSAQVSPSIPTTGPGFLVAKADDRQKPTQMAASFQPNPNFHQQGVTPNIQQHSSGVLFRLENPPHSQSSTFPPSHMLTPRSHPQLPNPYDLQSRHVRPNLQNSSTHMGQVPYNSSNNPGAGRWPTQLPARSIMGTGPLRGTSSSNLQETAFRHGKVYTEADYALDPHNPQLSIRGNIERLSSNIISQGQSQVRYGPNPNLNKGNIGLDSQSRGTVRPFAHSNSTYAQYSSQYQYGGGDGSSPRVYYPPRGSHHIGGPQNSQTPSGSGSYPVICRVSPIRNRLEPSLSSPPYLHHSHPFQKHAPPPSDLEYSSSLVGQRGQVSGYNLYQHDQYIERMRRQTTQFTLQALPGLPPQGGHHLLVKTESGQFQLIRVGTPVPALTAASGTQLSTPSPLPPSSPALTTTSSVTCSNAQPSSPSTTPGPLPLAPSSAAAVVNTTIGGLGQSVSQPLPGPVSFPPSVNFVSSSPSPRPPIISSSTTSSTTNSTTTVTTVSNSSIPSQVSAAGGTPATTTYRLQTVPSVPPTAASNSSGLGMTASMSMQQQMHLPPPHSQLPPSQAPSVLANTSATATTATTVSQMTPDTAKTKCKNFLSFLLELSAKQNQTVARNVKALIQGLVDGKVNAEDFSDRLQKEVNSQPQPCLVGFLKKSLPPLRHSLATKELSIEGIRAPILTSFSSPATPVTALIPQNQVRSPSIPTTTPVRIITPINSTPPSPTNSSPASIPRSTVAAVQQRFATPSKSSPTSKASKSSSPTTQSHPPSGKGSGKSTGKDKGKEKSFNAGYSGDDDINDVAAMGGVNLAEESQRILGSTELIGTQIRSCKDEAFLPTVPLQSKINAIVASHDLEEPSADVAAMISHALEERLKNILEKLSVVAEHRLDVIKLEDRYDVSQDVKGQLRFLEELDKLERKRHDEQEREMLIRAAKSRSKSEDPEQAKLKAKAKEMQRVALEEMRQREANLTALQAIGPRKKPKLDNASGSQSTISQTPQSNLGASSSVSRPQITMRPRLKRVSLRDLLFLLEQEKETTRKPE